MYRDPVNPKHHYHIYNRSNGKIRIYLCKSDYAKMIESISRFKHKYEITIKAYCIMPNHFHLLIGNIKSNVQLSRFMSGIQLSYCNYYNKKYNKIGHVFGGPYKRKDITQTGHLHIVKQYIFENPVKKKLVKNPEKWPYSGEFKW